MFSERTRWHRQTNRLTLRLEELRSAGRRILDLTLSNPTLAGLPYPSAALREALETSAFLRYEPHPRGDASARRAIAESYGEKGIQVDPDSILLTSGSSEAYTFLFRMLCNPGDAVLVPVPSYPLFDYLAALNDVQLRPYALQYDGTWRLEMATVRADETPAPKAVLLVHPHNPTGMFLKQGELRGVAALAREQGMAVLADEVFIDYPLTIDPLRAGSTAAQEEVLTFTINGLSKSAGLPQWKLGWIVVSGPPDQRREAMERLEIIADTYLSVNTPVQRALPRLLSLAPQIRAGIRQRTEENLSRLREHLRRVPGCSLLSLEGGWYATLRVPAIRSDEEWALLLLEEEGVVVHPGFFFDFPSGGQLVAGLLAEPGVFDEGVRRLVRVLERGLAA